MAQLDESMRDQQKTMIKEENVVWLNSENYNEAKQQTIKKEESNECESEHSNAFRQNIPVSVKNISIPEIYLTEIKREYMEEEFSDDFMLDSCREGSMESECRSGISAEYMPDCVECCLKTEPECEETASDEYTEQQFTQCFVKITPLSDTVMEKYLKEFENVSEKKLRNFIADKDYKCDTCEKTFTRKDNLNVHLQRHAEIKSYRCETCEKTFYSREAIKNHLEQHREIKPFKCKLCKKCFSRKSMLTRHLIIHTGIRAFKCDICKKSFVDNNNLRTHLRIHAGIKPYKCDICEKCFSLKSSLKRHLLARVRLYECEFCGKQLCNKNDLQLHMPQHAGNVSHKCHICEKTFSRNDNLRQHLKTHTGIKPFECEICGQKFTLKGGLNRHMKVVKHDGIVRNCDRGDFVESSS